MTEATKLVAKPRVRWGVYAVEGDHLRPAGLVGPKQELVLVAIVSPGGLPIAIELYRGERLRDRQEWTPPSVNDESLLAVRLGRSALLAASSRLRCRLLVDGLAIGQRTVLLAPTIDAQGRLAETPMSVSSEATHLAYVRLLEETWQPKQEKICVPARIDS
jgi:hypothetical protein